MLARWIKADGSQIDVTPANGTDFQLEEVQKMVGGYVEAVYLNKEYVMLVDEEGLLKEKPMNVIASTVYQAALQLGGIIVGDVLICKNKMFR